MLEREGAAGCLGGRLVRGGSARSSSRRSLTPGLVFASLVESVSRRRPTAVCRSNRAVVRLVPERRRASATIQVPPARDPIDTRMPDAEAIAIRARPKTLLASLGIGGAALGGLIWWQGIGVESGALAAMLVIALPLAI